MRCKNGIETSERIVPCGRCMPCRINAASVWTSRILMEQMATPRYCWFVTLTYSEAELPRTVEGVSTLRKKVVCNWRNNREKDVGKFRYYLVGEYGDLSLRPHYHLAVFPQEDFAIEELLEKWRYGFTSVAPLHGKRARYLAQYTTKKLTKDTDPRLERDQEPEFRTSSRTPGLGAPLVPAIVSRYRSGAGRKIIEERGDVERTIRIDGRTYPLGNFILAKVRKELGIPLLHRDRLTHEGYYEWHQVEEAEIDEVGFLNMEIQANAERQRKIHRTPHTRI